MSGHDIVAVAFLVVLKYLLNPLGLIPGLETTASLDGVHILLPELKLEASLQIGWNELKRYSVATRGLSPPSKLESRAEGGIGRLMLLPGLTTPLIAVLLTNRNCPIFALGSVNTKNRFEFIDPKACRDPEHLLDLPKAVVSAYMGGKEQLGRRVKRGIEFDIIIDVKAARIGSKDLNLVFRQIFTILTPLPRFANPVPRGEEADWAWDKDSQFSLNFDLASPYQWASVCADYNPIHISSIGARIFGFPERIAHGNHVLACALQQLEVSTKSHNSQQGMYNVLSSARSSAMVVQFKRPMVLPANLNVVFGSSDYRYGLRATIGEKDCLRAEVIEQVSKS